MDKTLSAPISLDDLLHSKALTPVPAVEINEIEKIQNLNVTDFSEAEVRAYVIDPIVRVLGYEKGTIFSVDLEKKIDFLNKRKFIDYKLMLWRENFWIIEAKKPKPRKKGFGYGDLKQVIEYAVHPDVNAALVALCDGNKLEIFDREESVVEPVLRVERKNLVRDFDKIRILLEPWQIWFFQKRRVVRLMDKVFDKEFNQSRVEEFKALIERRLDAKRTIILDNFRAQVRSDDDTAKFDAYLKTADIVDLVDVQFFLQRSNNATQAVIDTLVAHSSPNSFVVLHKIFPNNPRDANDAYYAHALMFLMALNEKQPSVNWLPAWLGANAGPNINVAQPIQSLIGLCLSQFESNEAQKVILLSAAAFRRIFKLLSVVCEDQWRIGQVQHYLERYSAPELSWSQIASSPARQILFGLDNNTILATSQFVRENSNEREEPPVQVMSLRLKELWNIEKNLLATVSDYPTLLKERNLGEIHPTEYIDVVHDFLGHVCLCMIDMYPAWKDYALQHHHAEIKTIASLGSWMAKKWLGLEIDDRIPPQTDSVIAGRFFFDDVETLQTLKKGYGFL